MPRFVTLWITAVGTVRGAALNARSTPFNWGSEKVRGVNIGGWLVLEPWITPSLFWSVDQSLGIVDEYTLCEKLPTHCPSILKSHWDLWVNFGDFQKIASAGMNTIRIPIGYWAYHPEGTPYISGAADYLDKAIEWARKTSPPLNVIIDLHGAPGSQNGFDNSGQRLPQSDITWLDGGRAGRTTQLTIQVLTEIAMKYTSPDYRDVILAIELLNEPIGWQLNTKDLKQFYRDAFNRIRAFGDVNVVMQDAFLPPSSYNGFLTPWDENAQNVSIDHHYYQVFDNYLIGLTREQHIQEVCKSTTSYTGADHWTFIGEWSGAMTDCAAYLNGYGIGARFDGSYQGSTFHGICDGINSLDTWDQGMIDDTSRYIEVQIDTFEANSQGWIFWNFKTEGSAEWDLFALLDAGVFPNPVTNRKFPPSCT